MEGVCLEEVKSKVAGKIFNLTEQTIEVLEKVWTELYEPEVCENNIKILTNHVEIFYNDIKEETFEKKQEILEDIKNLEKEIIDISDSLKVDVNFSETDNLKLLTKKYKLTDILNNLRITLNERKEEICKLLNEQKLLCNDLCDIEQKLLPESPLPTQQDLIDFHFHLNFLKTEKSRRIQEIDGLRHDIKILLKKLEINALPEDEKRILFDDHVPLSENTIQQLQNTRALYTKQLEDMNNDIDRMKETIEKLWEYLNIGNSRDFNKKFGKYLNEYTPTVNKIFHKELNRLNQIKRDNIKLFVEKLRIEILEWWGKTFKSDIERKRFINFTNDCYTEDLLYLHEMELEELKTFYEENEKIFQLIDERKKLWEKMIALERQASEPGRFNNRGGKLLQEERERKAVALKLPKIEMQLKELVQEYEEKNNRKFTINGDDILEIIENDWERRNQEKEKIMSARKNCAIPRTPLAAKNQITGIGSSLKKTTFFRNLTSATASAYKRPLPLDKESINPKAKRRLMDFTPTKLAESPKNSKILKRRSSQKAKPKKVTATLSIHNKHSGSRNSGKRKKSQASRRLPKIIVTTNDTIPTSYEIFQQKIENNPSSRSSIILKDTSENIEAASLRKPLKTPSSTRRMTRSKTKASQLPTPVKLKSGTLNIFSSSRNISGNISSLTGSNNNRKLTTKEIPILF